MSQDFLSWMRHTMNAFQNRDLNSYWAQFKFLCILIFGYGSAHVFLKNK